MDGDDYVWTPRASLNDFDLGGLKFHPLVSLVDGACLARGRRRQTPKNQRGQVSQVAVAGRLAPVCSLVETADGDLVIIPLPEQLRRIFKRFTSTPRSGGVDDLYGRAVGDSATFCAQDKRRPCSRSSQFD